MAGGKRYIRMEEMRAKALRQAVELFLVQGYNETTLDQIAAGLDRTKAALLRAYPDKESILLALVVHMFGSQFENVRKILGGKADPLLVYGVETALQLHICELSESLRDVYVSAYTLPRTSEYIYQHTAKELTQIFAEYLPDAAESDFYELEIASGSIMRGYMTRKCDMYFTMERKLRVFLSASLKIYDVPSNRREEVIAGVLSMDIREMARRIVDQTVKIAEIGFQPEVLKDMTGEM